MVHNYITGIFRKTGFLTAFFTCSFFQTMQAQNLITNGSFENASPTTCATGSSGCFTVPGDCYFCGSTGTFIPGWNLSSGNVDRYRAYTDSGSILFTGVPDSAWGLDMNGNNPGTITQTVSGLMSGATYVLSFSRSNNTRGPSCLQDKPIRVSVFDSTTSTLIRQTDYSTAGLSTEANAWKDTSMTFVPTGTSINVQFQSIFGDAGTIASCGGGTSTSFYGPALDKVQLVLSTPLPVNLVSFGAIRQSGNDVLVSWTTGNESDSKQYEVLYSEDGQNFTVVHMVPVKKNKKQSDYSFIHQATNKSDKGFYRLKCLQTDGSLTYSGIAIVYHNELLQYKLQYTAEAGVFSIAGVSAGDLMTVVDMLGRPVGQFKAISGDNRIKLNNIANGLYVLRVTNPFKTVTLKILITAN